MNKSILFLVSTFFLAQSVLANPEPSKITREIAKGDAPMTAEVLAVFFTPPTGAARGLIRYLDGAKKSIQVMAYSFTYLEIADALARAAKRGVDVQVIQDGPTAANNFDVVPVLLKGGVSVRGNKAHRIFHHKVMIIDSDIVVTGSYNFTNSAEKSNAENMIILRSTPLAQQYYKNFISHWERSYPITTPPERKTAKPN
ncbi:MAG: phospholipase D family protein [Betaproteobacteria bacterium]|nr:phospholipase D family protein [Betaproteobacteria bacterium]